MRRAVHAITASPAHLFFFVLAIYFLSSFFSVSMKDLLPLPQGTRATSFARKEYVIFSLPRILRGDEMYYLMMANSLAADGDLRLSNNYATALRGGLDMGIYHRFRPAENFVQHFSRAPDGYLLGKHPFGLSLLLAMLLWPFANTAWMEAGSIWVTAAAGATGVLIFMRVLLAMDVPWPKVRRTALLLAFATPWWSYSRTLYTEVYMGCGLLVVVYCALKRQPYAALPASIFLAWFKYPGLLLFFSAGLCELVFRKWKAFLAIGAVGFLVFCAIVFFNHSYFSGSGFVEHTTRSAKTLGAKNIVRADAPIAWVPGKFLHNIKRVFLDWDKGLFPCTPILFFALWGGGILYKTNRQQALLILSCAVPWILLHLSYKYLMSGASYSTRYLVPAIPVVMLMLPAWTERLGGWWKKTIWYGAVAISVVTNIGAGLFPAISFDHNPAQIWMEMAAIAARPFR